MEFDGHLLSGILHVNFPGTVMNLFFNWEELAWGRYWQMNEGPQGDRLLYSTASSIQIKVTPDCICSPRKSTSQNLQFVCVCVRVCAFTLDTSWLFIYIFFAPVSIPSNYMHFPYFFLSLSKKIFHVLWYLESVTKDIIFAILGDNIY